MEFAQDGSTKYDELINKVIDLCIGAELTYDEVRDVLNHARSIYGQRAKVQKEVSTQVKSTDQRIADAILRLVDKRIEEHFGYGKPKMARLSESGEAMREGEW